MSQIVETETPVPQEVVRVGSTLSTLVQEIMSMSAELDARRRFDREVADWLTAVGLGAVFEVWRRAQEGNKLPPTDVVES